MVLLLSLWRKRGDIGLFERLSNWGLIVSGVLLFQVQMHGYLHQVDVDEFGFSEDLHHHARESMESAQQQKYVDIGKGMVQNSEAGLSQKEVVQRAQVEIPHLIAEVKVPEEWSSVRVISSEKVQYDDEVEWVISLNKQIDE